MAEDAVEKYSTNSGSAIKPQYAQREMKCYAVTESELKQIGLANIVSTAFFALGSAAFAFALDIFKDTQMTDAVPTSAQMLIGTIQPLGFYAGLTFWAFAIVAWLWRWDMLRMIKSESK